MFGRLFSSKAPLTGAPAVRRMKTYSASSGYVYQYFYEGQRRAGKGSRAATEYVFSVSSDRAHWRNLTMAVSDRELASWYKAGGHELSSSERYAVAKMALFLTFDSHEVPDSIPGEVRVAETAIAAIAGTLGWE